MPSPLNPMEGSGLDRYPPSGTILWMKVSAPWAHHTEGVFFYFLFLFNTRVQGIPMARPRP